MHNSMNPSTNQAGLLERYLGTGYQHVKTVSERIAEVRHLSENMESMHELYMAIPVMQAFVTNPEFLPWLEENKDALEDLSELLGTTLELHARLDEPAEFETYVRLGTNGIARQEAFWSLTSPIIGSSNGVEHNLSADKIIDISGVVHKLGGEIEKVGFLSGSPLRVWVDSTHIRMSVEDEATSYAARPVHVILSYIA
jgi:hypothetical protein